MADQKQSGAEGDRRIILRVLTGARANQVEEVTIADAAEIVLGRDPDVAVQFDAERDDLVSRRHARIAWDGDGADGTGIYLEDLGSSNGTLLNGVRITEQAPLRPGDTLQLGAGGPKVAFDLEPRPTAPPATRLAAAAMPAATRQASSYEPPATATPVVDTAMPPPSSVGRETVERMVSSAEQKSRRSAQLIGLALAIVAVVAAILFYLDRRESTGRDEKLEEMSAEMSATLSPSEISDLYRNSVVFIEGAWTLEHTETGEEIYHRFMQGDPAYVRLPDGSVEPWLLDDDESGTNRQISEQFTATGFVVKPDGFILTNRHVAAGWRSTFRLPLPGRLYEYNSRTGQVDRKEDLTEADRGLISGWIPTAAAAFGRKLSLTKVVEGRFIYFDVTFPQNTLRLPARVVRVSDTHDVALIKIDTPNPVNPVALHDNYDSIRVGAPVTVIGYPGMSPIVGVMIESQDALDRSSEFRQVPDPSLSTGVIGRVIRGTAVAAGSPTHYSSAGDVYQLTVDTAGTGNSGGPVFDDRGRVIGIFTYLARSDVTLSFAVPIRYGEELMSISPVLR